MKTRNQWKVQQLLRLAELCSDDEGEKRRFYMEEAENLLFLDVQSSVGFSHLNEEFQDIEEFHKLCKESNFAIENNLISEVYKSYVSFCEDRKLKFRTKVSFSKGLRAMYGYSSKVVHLRPLGTKRVYTLE